MALKRKKSLEKHSLTLKDAQEVADSMVEDDIYDELFRVGAMWAGLLKLETPIAPSEVAAMLSTYELVRATRFIDSQQHWSNVASFAAIGSFCEPHEMENTGASLDVEKPLPIGFSPGHTISPKD